jgi:hypothetical protein
MAYSANPPVACWFLAHIVFNPEDEGDTFLQNVGSHTDYMVLYPRRWKPVFEA